MVRILLAEPSYLVRKGLSSILNELKTITKIDEIAGHEELKDALESLFPNLILINTTISSLPEIDKILKKHSSDLNIISIYNAPLPDDGNESSLSLFDSKPMLLSKLRNQIKRVQKTVLKQENSEDLSEREKDVLQKIALGKINKEIASELFISTHTVISHRKNITRKLGIKTVSGLTVYAILNQLIKLEDIS